MNFTESYLCRDGRYCVICRNLEGGRKWRELVLRLYPEACLDFICPNGKTWGYAAEHITGRGAYLTSGEVGDLAIEHVNDIVKALGDHPIVQRVLAAADDLKHGCSGCKRGRVFGNLGSEIGKLDAETKKRVYLAIGLS